MKVKILKGGLIFCKANNMTISFYSHSPRGCDKRGAATEQLKWLGYKRKGDWFNNEADFCRI